jgi:hypothetical protein
MPKSGQAKNSLVKSRPRGWREQVLAEIARLPKGLRPAAYASLGCNADGEDLADGKRRAAARQEAARILDDSTARARLQVFETLLPELARHVEAGWQLGQRLPYQRGDAGRVFRAPNSPAVSQRARGDWLAALVELLGGHRHGVSWLAARAPEIDGFAEGDILAVLFAAAIDAGDREGKKVFDILADLLRGEGRKGSVRPHATRALLLASRPDGWELVEKVLPSPHCPDEERRVILEGSGEAHRDAFRRMLRLIQVAELARTPEVVHTLNGWLGYAWGAVSVRLVNGVLGRVLEFLDDPAARTKALKTDDAETAYLALWALAFDDAVAAVKPAAKLARDASVERRFAAVHLLGQLDLPEARKPLREALDDKDLRVALRALEGFGRDTDEEENGRRRDDLFEPLERLLQRMPPERTPLDPIIWPWHVLIADAQAVAADLIGHLGHRPASRLLPHLPKMDVERRGEVMRRAAGMKQT